MTFWGSVKWGGSVLVILVIAIAALSASNNTGSRGKSPAGAYQSGSSSDEDRYKSLKLH